MSLAQPLTKLETHPFVKINCSPYHYCPSKAGEVCNGFRHYVSAYEYTQGKFAETRKRKIINAAIECPHVETNLIIFAGMER